MKEIYVLPKKCQPWGKKKFLPVKPFFLPVKKKRVPVKKISGREKTEKSVRENVFLLVKKKDKNAKKGFHGHFLFSRGKKYIQEISK